MDVRRAWVHWRIDGIFTFFLEVTHCIEEKKPNQKECNKFKVGVYIGVGGSVHNNRQHLVDSFQNRTTVYGMKNCSHSGK